MSKPRKSSQQNPEPLVYQVKALEHLSGLRTKGIARALIVMASGLGKTYTAAFDALQFQKDMRKPIKVLYLSHQNVILEQAKITFRRVFGEKRKYGRFDGERQDLEAELLFATFQSFSGHLVEFSAYKYDYVIIDEAHHSVAPTRDAVIAYLRPRFMLGLTATPLRGDGKDIYSYYDDTIALSLPLEKALVEGLLTPIDYHVVSDPVDADSLTQALRDARKGDKNIFRERLDKEISGLVLEASRRLFKIPRIIVFCATLAQMDHFAKLFPSSRTISGRNSRDEQLRIIKEFSAGDFSVLLARDVLNEGVDLPDANTLVFLRNTESPVVFLQQLGRGLRKAAGKRQVLVLDFVNNLERIDFVYSFFSRLEMERRARRARGEIDIIPQSELRLDSTAREVLSALIEKKVAGKLIVDVHALVMALNNIAHPATLQHIIGTGRLIPDFSWERDTGRREYYFERATYERFLRHVHSRRFVEGLMHESQFARKLGKTVKWLKAKERHGTIKPSWLHQRADGNWEFYYSELDFEQAKEFV